MDIGTIIVIVIMVIAALTIAYLSISAKVSGPRDYGTKESVQEDRKGHEQQKRQ